MTDVIDSVLERFAARGPEFGPGLANHGPMAVDALVALGRSDVVEPWSEWYATRLADRPRPRHTIALEDWREALGDVGRAGDWSVFFQRQLSEHPWRDALTVWMPRLLPGIMAGATHGVLRTAHAVRSLARDETPQRIAELGEGLAYWAARYQELPAAPERMGQFGVASALAHLPHIDPSRRKAFLIFDQVKELDADAFAPAINLVDTTTELDSFVTDVTTTFAHAYLENARHSAIAFVHTVTAPSALRILAPVMSEETQRLAMRYAWQACAAIYAAYARPAPEAIAPTTELDNDDLVDRAVNGRDEHAIKFTEACLREHRICGDAVFLSAAADAVERLRAV